MRTKHRNDQNHGKNGFVGGNARYKRRRAKRAMGKATVRNLPRERLLVDEQHHT